MLSVNRLTRRRSPFTAQQWILDSGAFTRITKGQGHLPIARYIEIIERFRQCGELQAVVSQDYMCEPIALEATRLSVKAHQAMSTERFLSLKDSSPAPVMPVVQGFTVDEYQYHAAQLSPYIEQAAWVGVGSVCKRQGSPASLAAILEAILQVRPDWRLHGFGIKMTALQDARCCRLLHSIDSMAWCYQSLFSSDPTTQRVEAALSWLERLEQIEPQPEYQTALQFPAAS